MENPPADGFRGYSQAHRPSSWRGHLKSLAAKLIGGLRPLVPSQTAGKKSLPDFLKGLGLALLVGGGIWLLLTAHPLALALVFAGLALWLADGRI